MDLNFQSNLLAGKLVKDFHNFLLERSSNTKNRVIAFYTGRFQPFHAGHQKVYNTLVRKFGKENVFISTMDENLENSEPLTHDDQKSMITKMFNVNEEHIQKSENPFIPKEVLKKFDPSHTSFISVVSNDDAKILSTSKYFHHYVDGSPLKPFKEAGYYLPIPEIQSKIGNKSLSNSQLIQLFGSSDVSDASKKALFKRVFGKDNPDVMNQLIDKSKKSSVDKSVNKTQDLKYDKSDSAGDGPSKTKAPSKSTSSHKKPTDHLIVNPETGREIKIRSALKYPRWKPVYKKAERVLKIAGVDRSDRVKDPEVNQRYRNRSKKTNEEYISLDFINDVVSRFINEFNGSISVSMPMLGEDFIFEFNDNLLLEGGAYGHMLHPYEDLDLSFGQLKNIATKAVSTGLSDEGPVTEKTDGQNLMFSVINGKIRFARSIGQIKKSGAESMTVQDLKSKFAGRGDIEHTFGAAGDDLQAAVEKLPVQMVDKLFGNGKKFMSVEVIHPSSENVIPYGNNMLILHHTIEYDDDGNAINHSTEDSELMSSALKNVQADRQREFGIRGQQFVVFSDEDAKKTNEKIQKYNKLIDQFQQKHGLTDKSTIRDYQMKWWSSKIDSISKNENVELTDQDKQVLLNRIVNGDKTVRLTKLSSYEAAEFGKKLEAAAKHVHRDAIYPLQVIVAMVGMDAIARATNLLSSQNALASQQILQKLKSSIELIKSSGRTDKLEEIDRFMKLLDDIDFSTVVPSEGLVFNYNGKLYKFTGAFAPINRIIGAVKYSDMAQTQSSTTSTTAAEPQSTTSKKPIAVYNGRFQPFHAGHYHAYEALVKKYGADNVYIGTSDKVEPGKSPFSYQDKFNIMTSMFGIDPKKIIQVKNPYNVKELQSTLGLSDDTPVVFALGEKDVSRLSYPGAEKYYKPIQSGPLQGLSTIAYTDVVPQLQMKVGDQVISGDAIRKVFSSDNDAAKRALFKQLYGTTPDANAEIYNLIASKVSDSSRQAADIEKQKKDKFQKTAAAAQKKEKIKPYLGDKVDNPETQRQITVGTAMGYDTAHPAYKNAIKYLKSKGVTFDEQ